MAVPTKLATRSATVTASHPLLQALRAQALTRSGASATPPCARISARSHSARVSTSTSSAVAETAATISGSRLRTVSAMYVYQVRSGPQTSGDRVALQAGQRQVPAQPLGELDVLGHLALDDEVAARRVQADC